LGRRHCCVEDADFAALERRRIIRVTDESRFCTANDGQLMTDKPGGQDRTAPILQSVDGKFIESGRHGRYCWGQNRPIALGGGWCDRQGL
jgi:hypothetical protein